MKVKLQLAASAAAFICGPALGQEAITTAPAAEPLAPAGDATPASAVAADPLIAPLGAPAAWSVSAASAANAFTAPLVSQSPAPAMFIPPAPAARSVLESKGNTVIQLPPMDPPPAAPAASAAPAQPGG